MVSSKTQTLDARAHTYTYTILLRHPRKHKNACNCSRPGSPDESGGENTKVRAPRMEFLRNALFVFIIGVVYTCVCLRESARKREREERERERERESTSIHTQHARDETEKNIARAFDVSSLTRSYKKTSEGIRMKVNFVTANRDIRKRINRKMRQIELIR
jgi:hypothetical protein